MARATTGCAVHDYSRLSRRVSASGPLLLLRTRAMVSPLSMGAWRCSRCADREAMAVRACSGCDREVLKGKKEEGVRRT